MVPFVNIFLQLIVISCIFSSGNISLITIESIWSPKYVIFWQGSKFDFGLFEVNPRSSKREIVSWTCFSKVSLSAAISRMSSKYTTILRPMNRKCAITGRRSFVNTLGALQRPNGRHVNSSWSLAAVLAWGTIGQKTTRVWGIFRVASLPRIYGWGSNFCQGLVRLQFLRSLLQEVRTEEAVLPILILLCSQWLQAGINSGPCNFPSLQGDGVGSNS